MDLPGIRHLVMNRGRRRGRVWRIARIFPGGAVTRAVCLPQVGGTGFAGISFSPSSPALQEWSNGQIFCGWEMPPKSSCFSSPNNVSGVEYDCP